MLCRIPAFFLIVSAAVCVSQTLPAQQHLFVLDQEAIESAMLDEVLDRIDNRHRGSRELFDYLTIQAHEAVKQLLPRRNRNMPPLWETLLDLYRGRHQAEAPNDYRQAVDFFVQAMSGEVFESLSFEFDELEQKVQCLQRAASEIKLQTGITPEFVKETLRYYGISAKSISRGIKVEKQRLFFPGEKDSYSRYQAIKQQVFNCRAHDGLALIFNLGDKHREKTAFNEEFFTQYLEQVEKYLALCHEINDLL